VCLVGFLYKVLVGRIGRFVEFSVAWCGKYCQRLRAGFGWFRYFKTILICGRCWQWWWRVSGELYRWWGVVLRCLWWYNLVAIIVIIIIIIMLLLLLLLLVGLRNDDNCLIGGFFEYHVYGVICGAVICEMGEVEAIVCAQHDLLTKNFRVLLLLVLWLVLINGCGVCVFNTVEREWW